MIFLADESLEFPVIRFFRDLGYDVFSISETTPSIPDDEVLKIAFDQNRILLTTDKDFGELVFRLRLPAHGVVLLRMPELSNTEKTTLLTTVIPKIEKELSGSFTVITAQKVRIVPLLMS